MSERTSYAMALIHGLTLPDGRRLGASLGEDPWLERDVLLPILAEGDDGLPVNRYVWIELSRGHAKTFTLAAVAMAEASSSYGTDVLCVASDADQARLITESLAGQCFRNPKLAAAFVVGKDEFRVKHNNSRIRVFASDAPSFYGLGVNSRRLRIVCDELTQWAKRDMLDAALTTLPKVADSQLVVITNAGLEGSWQQEARATFEADGYLFAAPGVIASWITADVLAGLRRKVPESVYRRFYENQWVSSDGDFITTEMLRRCIDVERTPRLRGEYDVRRYVIGVDLGMTHDRTVRAITHYDRELDLVVLDAMRVWEGSKESPMVIADLEDDLIDCDSAFNRPLVYVDPWQMKGSVQRLRSKLRIEEYAFSGPSVMRLSETLFGLISSAKLRLYPDADLERELVQLQVKQTSMGWRVDHQRGGFSDRAIALGVSALGAVTKGTPLRMRSLTAERGAKPVKPGEWEPVQPATWRL